MKTKILELSIIPEYMLYSYIQTTPYQISKQYLYIWLCNGKKKTGEGDDVTSFK